MADNKLVHLEAVGVNVAAVMQILGEPEQAYLGMKVYDAGRVWLDESERRLLWLDEQALHPNLLAWRHSALQVIPESTQTASLELPALFDFHTELESLKPRFEQVCPILTIEQISKTWLPNQPAKQVQLNCFNFVYAGFARKVEAVFGDGRLQVVWVLTAKPEETRLRQLLQQQWGDPIVNNTNWEVYGNGRISLRKDKPELLILSDKMIPLFQNRFSP